MHQRAGIGGERKRGWPRGKSTSRRGQTISKQSDAGRLRLLLVYVSAKVRPRSRRGGRAGGHAVTASPLSNCAYIDAEPFGPPPVPVAVCPPEHAEMAAYLAQTADGDPYRTNASINNNPPYFVAQLLCLPQQTAFLRVSMCCFDIDLWITILADELAKREADTDKVFTREIEIGSPCRLQSSNDSHPWYSNQYLSQASHEAFVKIDDFMLARAASPDDYDMILPLVCRECRGVDTSHSENYKRTNFIRRENECEHCHAPIGRAMARVCFDSCSDKIGRLCSCLQPTEEHQ